MPEKEDIITLFRNIQQGIKKYNIKSVNDAIEKAIDSIDTTQKSKQEQINLVLKSVCNEYAITREQLIRSKSRGEIQQAKIVTYCLLHYQLGLTIRHIAQKVFFRNHHTSVALGVKYFKNLNTNIKPDKEFNDRFERVKSVVLNNLLKK